jgi:hypothetical protein
MSKSSTREHLVEAKRIINQHRSFIEALEGVYSTHLHPIAPNTLPSPLQQRWITLRRLCDPVFMQGGGSPSIEFDEDTIDMLRETVLDAWSAMRDDQG